MSDFLSNRTSLAVAVQADNVTRATISTPADLLPIANLSNAGEVFTADNPEYTGSIHAVGSSVFGRSPGITFDMMMRGPGGSAPPAANAYGMGRLFRAAGFDEIVFSGKMTATLAAGGSNTGATTTVVLDATAVSTDDFYTGMVIQFATLNGGSGYKSCSTIIAYNGTTKTATLGEKLASVPTGGFTIPPQLVYRLNGSANPLWLTFDRWHDRKRYQAQNGILSQLSMNFPTANRGDVSFATLSAGIVGDDATVREVDENAPLTPAAGAIPPVRDGKLALNGVYVPGSSLSYDHGIQVAFPPNPNRPGGNDAGRIVRTQRSLSMNLQTVTLATQDRTALAALQGYVPVMLHYGNVAGRSVSFCVPQARLNFSNPELGGEFVTEQVDAFIDGSTNAVAISFPFYT